MKTIREEAAQTAIKEIITGYLDDKSPEVKVDNVSIVENSAGEQSIEVRVNLPINDINVKVTGPEKSQLILCEDDEL